MRLISILVILIVISRSSYADTIPADTVFMQHAELEEITLIENKHVSLIQD